MDLVVVDQYIPVATEYGARVIGALVLAIAALWAAGKVKKLVHVSMNTARLDQTLAKFVSNVAKWAVLVAAGVSILGLFGIQTASFAAVIAAMGLAIGLAFQGTLSNLASGVMLLIFSPFHVGQVITVGGVSGTVDEIELFTTTIDTPDKRRFIMPNAQVFGATIENISYHATRRVDITVGVDYQAKIETTREVLLAAVHSVGGILKEPAPAVSLSGLGPSSVDWSINVWVKAGDFGSVKEALLKAVKNSLDEAQIAIPYPKMDINVSSNRPIASVVKDAVVPTIQPH
jgi:small conductance mechanosensitive channel